MHDSVPPRASSTNTACAHRASEAAAHGPFAHPTSMTPHVVFMQYVERHKAYAEHTRQSHEQERELWHLERAQLLERIRELEQAVKQLGGDMENPLHSPDRHGVQSHYAPSLDAKTGSTIGAGSEFWKGAGGIGLTQPTRAFSEPSTTSHPSILRPHHLPSIHETSDVPKKSVGFDMAHTGSIEKDFHVHPIPVIPVIAGDADFDSITFKPSALSSSSVSHLSSGTQSPSPMHTPQNQHLLREPKPQIIDLPASNLTASVLLVKDAGHTPLARLADSDESTPFHDTPKQAAPPLVAEAKPARPPTERADSYFSAADVVVQAAPKDDPALREPLALTAESDAPGNNEFLNALDSKLREAQQPGPASETDKSPESHHIHANGAHGTNDANGEVRLSSEEPEPALRIKDSTNFGTAFGAANVGRDF